MNIINNGMTQNKFVFSMYTTFFSPVSQIVYSKQRFKNYRNSQIPKRDRIKLQKQVRHFTVSYLCMEPQSDNLRPNSRAQQVQSRRLRQGAWTVSCCDV